MAREPITPEYIEQTFAKAKEWVESLKADPNAFLTEPSSAGLWSGETRNYGDSGALIALKKASPHLKTMESFPEGNMYSRWWDSLGDLYRGDDWKESPPEVDCNGSLEKFAVWKEVVKTPPRLYISRASGTIALRCNQSSVTSVFRQIEHAAILSNPNITQVIIPAADSSERNVTYNSVAEWDEAQKNWWLNRWLEYASKDSYRIKNDSKEAFTWRKRESFYKDGEYEDIPPDTIDKFTSFVLKCGLLTDEIEEVAKRYTQIKYFQTHGTLPEGQENKLFIGPPEKALELERARVERIATAARINPAILTTPFPGHGNPDRYLLDDGYQCPLEMFRELRAIAVKGHEMECAAELIKFHKIYSNAKISGDNPEQLWAEAHINIWHEMVVENPRILARIPKTESQEIKNLCEKAYASTIVMGEIDGAKYFEDKKWEKPKFDKVISIPLKGEQLELAKSRILKIREKIGTIVARNPGIMKHIPDEKADEVKKLLFPKGMPDLSRVR